MNYTIALLLFFVVEAIQNAPAIHSEALVGSVVKYDASMSSRTSQADLVLKLKDKGKNKYVRLRYAPNGFGFDAPAAKPEQILPKEMFSNGSLVWTFHVHVPRNREEQMACTGRVKQYAPGKEGALVEVERFALVPGQENENIPKPETLSCFVMESWAKSIESEGR